mmetsp:Transcript_10080/g.39260  ORF Transcript_10080/g.39260 Transcript_10080/m.39260 type:complete len:240 (-) Transcript_10080:386-1105(-)
MPRWTGVRTRGRCPSRRCRPCSCQPGARRSPLRRRNPRWCGQCGGRLGGPARPWQPFRPHSVSASNNNNNSASNNNSNSSINSSTKSTTRSSSSAWPRRAPAGSCSGPARSAPSTSLPRLARCPAGLLRRSTAPSQAPVSPPPPGRQGTPPERPSVAPSSSSAPRLGLVLCRWPRADLAAPARRGAGSAAPVDRLRCSPRDGTQRAPRFGRVRPNVRARVRAAAGSLSRAPRHGQIRPA